MNIIKNIFICHLPVCLISINGLSQTADSTDRTILMNPVHAGFLITQDTVKSLPEITMPAYRSLPQKDKKVGVHVRPSSQSDGMVWRSSNTTYRDPKAQSIDIYPKNYESYGRVKKKPDIGLDIDDYVLPTREEYEVLQILWDKGDILDASIYASADSSMNTTMMRLNQTLEEMVRKRLVSREMVSARFEFNAFGIPIEMSPLNRKNRIFLYRTRVDKSKLKNFINARHFEAAQDSSILKDGNLKAARSDSTLLRDLNLKMWVP